MSVTMLLLPWFPIILGVGVGGRLLGRPQGTGLGIICAVFWVLLVQASAGTAVWWNALAVAALLAGSAAIIAMGAWSGEVGLALEKVEDSRPLDATIQNLPAAKTVGSLQDLTDAMQRFDDWFEEHGGDSNPWMAFDEFVRMTLRRICGARHIKPLRLRNDMGDLVPLRASDPMTEDHHISARAGIIGHVVTSGRTYLAGDSVQGDLVAQLAAEAAQPVAWCFPIKHGAQRYGVVVVQEFESRGDYILPLLRTCEKLINVWWLALRELCVSREAVSADPISGLNARGSFLRKAERTLAESYARGEPAAMAVIAIEHLRDLNDHGRWDTADELITEVGRILRRKVRSDDTLGRFDESRFVVLLRRVDSELASLIVKQILVQLHALCRDTARWGTMVPLHCGLAGSGTDEVEAQALLSRALEHCMVAHERNELCSGDITAGDRAVGVSS